MISLIVADKAEDVSYKKDALNSMGWKIWEDAYSRYNTYKFVGEYPVRTPDRFLHYDTSYLTS